jgi:NAD(P)H-flavin reductase
VLAQVLAAMHSTLTLYLCSGPLLLCVIDWWHSARRREAAGQTVLSLYASRLWRSAHENGPRLVKLVVVAPTLTWSAGQFVYLNVPAIDPHYWYPCYLSSDPNRADKQVSVHLLAPSDAALLAPSDASASANVPGSPSFLNSVADLVEKGQSARCALSIDGPYGHTHLRHDWKTAYDQFVLICGGIGAAPIMSYLSDLLHCHASNLLPHLTAVHVVWVVPDEAAISNWFAPLIIQCVAAGAPFFLHIYVTGSLARRMAAIGADPHAIELSVLSATTPASVDMLTLKTADAVAHVPVRRTRPDVLALVTRLASRRPSVVDEEEDEEEHAGATSEATSREREQLMRDLDGARRASGRDVGAVVACGPNALVLDALQAAASSGWHAHALASPQELF